MLCGNLTAISAPALRLTGIQVTLLLAAVFMCDAAHSAYVTAPQLLEWDFVPKTVDVTKQAQLVTVTFRVTDDISGTETPKASLNN